MPRLFLGLGVVVAVEVVSGVVGEAGTLLVGTSMKELAMIPIVTLCCGKQQQYNDNSV